MRRVRPLSYHLSQRTCSQCNNILLVSPLNCRCENCNEPGISCTCTACKLSKDLCLRCGCNFRKSEKNIKSREIVFSEKNQIASNKKWSFFVPVLLISLIGLGCYYIFSLKAHEDTNILIKRLKSYYASQKNETWYHILSVLENEVPSVKSITFLHGEDKKTLNCLTKELVSLYTIKQNMNSKIRVEEITFSMTGSEVRDYGFLLADYHAVLEKFKVLITDLSKVPGNVARIFHTLCDEESSDIKPSLFIFTLKYDKKTADLKPLERATTILKEAWRNLPQNEIFPLLSRIIKNVVDVVPEQKVNC